MKNDVPSIEKHRRQHLALAILRLLDRQPGYCSNDRIMTGYFQDLALTTTAAETRLCLGMLERLGLVKSTSVDDVVVATLTEAGQDVATGRVMVDGVLRPGPECPY